MAQARASARVDVDAPAELAATAIAALRARGISAQVGDTDVSIEANGVFACALPTAPTAAAAVELAAKCVRAAEAGRPVCVLVPAVRGTGRAAVERAAALAHLHAHGAAVAHDVDAWLEAIVLLVRFGLPTGPLAAVVAPEGSWLRAQATAIVAEAEAESSRLSFSTTDDPTDVVIYDPALDSPSSTTPGLHVPVAPRAELATPNVPALFGARAALGAIDTLGRAAQRIAVGLGPAPRAASAELSINRELLERQRDRLIKQFANQMRIGDHETKVLLRAYGVEITRQKLGMTPSAAVNAAREVGYPVEIKPYGNELPSEPQGCPVERNVSSDALVRQAFGSVLSRVNAPEGAVIVRETPPVGRDISVTFLELPSLGWTVVLDAPGARIAAAPAPLRLVDAEALATHVIASRANEPEPDRTGLANILRRTSHLVVDLADRIATLELPRVVVGGRGARTVVVDAFATLR